MRWLLLTLLLFVRHTVAAPPEQSKPVVTIIVSDEAVSHCQWCIVARKDVEKSSDLPFIVKFTTKQPPWFSALPEHEQLVPTAYWKAPGASQRLTGWHGIPLLVDEWQKTQDAPGTPKESRDPRWQAASKKYLQKNRTCICCGKKAVVTHHLKPFHLFPELEMEPSNWRAMCAPCHLIVGHLGNFSNYNPALDEHAAILLTAKRAADLARETPDAVVQ